MTNDSEESYTVLVAVDDSDPAEEAVEFAADRFPDASLTLLNVAPSSAPVTDTRVHQEAAEREATETLLGEYEDRLGDGPSVETRVVEGSPAREIVDYATEHEVDHILIGSHGRRGLNRLILGSVAEKVVRRSPLPVTVVR